MNIKRFLYERFSFISDFILSTVNIKDLSMLSYNIPDIPTNEICKQNDFYGHAYHFKKYCNLPSEYQLKCVIEHGIYNRYYAWDCDINNDMPVIFSIGDYRKEFLSQKCNKKHYSLGPYIHYVNTLYSSSKIKKEKKRLGKNLLVFPTHSTHHSDVEYDSESFCKEILKIKNEHNFKSVRVCMYWKDIINGYHKIYQKYGFECVCAGHMFDKYFLPRLKSIISISDVTMSNSDGTHLGYCLYLNKPHYLWIQEKKYNLDEVSIKEKDYKNVLRIKTKEEQQNFEKLFSVYSENILPTQLDAIEKRFSFSKIKTKSELLTIIKEAERQYNIHKSET